MNILERLNRSIRATGRRYANGEISQDEMIAARERVDRLRNRFFWLQGRNRRRERFASVRRAVERVREAVRTGGRMIAYDTEYVNDGPVQQLGITVYENGVMTTRTYTTPGFDRSVVIAGLYGEDDVRSSQEMREIAQALYRRDAIQVFHAAQVEFGKLGLEPSAAYYVDTARIGHVFYRKANIPGLAQLCARYKIDTTGHHNAGNDSRYTMQVLLALAADPAWDRAETHAFVWSDRVNEFEKFAPTRFPPPTPEQVKASRRALVRSLRESLGSPTSIHPADTSAPVE